MPNLCNTQSPIPKQNNSPVELLYCNILKSSYINIKSIITTVTVIPKKLLNRTKSTIKLITRIQLKKILNSLKLQNKSLDNILKLKNINKNVKLQNVCDVINSCIALKTELATFPSFSGVDFTDSQEVTEKICKNGLNELLNDVVLNNIAKVSNFLGEISTELIEIGNEISNLENIYNNTLNTRVSPLDKNIYEYIDLLDDFIDCGFSKCTVKNESRDFKSELIKTLAIGTKVFNDEILKDYNKIYQEVNEYNQIILDKLYSVMNGCKNTVDIESIGGLDINTIKNAKEF